MKSKYDIEDSEPLFDEKVKDNIPTSPYGETMEDWIRWVYSYLRMNRGCLSIVEIYENTKIEPPFTLSETLDYNDVEINTLLENRIINLTLKNKVKSVFAQSLLRQKYGWTDNANEVPPDTDISFKFG